MKHPCIYKLIIIITLNLAFILPSTGNAEYKKIEINGLKIYNEQSLIRDAGLPLLKKDKFYFKSVSKKIIKFYRNKGYSLVKVYLIRENRDILSLYIDEGEVMRIIFKKLNSVDIIKMKYEFDLKDKIYNKNIVKSEISRIKKKYNYRDIRVRLERSVKGDEAFFQLDNTFSLPLLGDTRLPFFTAYSPRYNLIIIFNKKNKSENGGFSIGLSTSYSRGLIPKAEYSIPNLLKKKDRLLIGASMGWYYGLDFKFKEYPRWTFIELFSEYHFTPLFSNYFTPMASLSNYYSRASRNDIGLLNYNYLLMEGILAPGIALFRELRLYIGAGGERVFIFSPKIDQDADYVVDIEEATDTWAVIAGRFKLDIRPWSLKNANSHKFESVFKYYTNKVHFYSLSLEMKGELEFRNLDFFNFTLIYFKIWEKPPFYHEHSVSDSNFKGFMGKSIYTRNVIKSSNEYKISVYKDSYYLGIFADLVRFEGSGYDFLGYQHGLVAGIAGHIIFLDQFEFNVFYGKDYLFSTEESQYNIYLNARKKW